MSHDYVTWLCDTNNYMLRIDDRSKFLSRWIINESLLGGLDPTFDFWLTYWPLQDPIGQVG